jgi:hypothetical protein
VLPTHKQQHGLLKLVLQRVICGHAGVLLQHLLQRIEHTGWGVAAAGVVAAWL